MENRLQMVDCTMELKRICFLFRVLSGPDLATAFLIKYTIRCQGDARIPIECQGHCNWSKVKVKRYPYHPILL